MKKLIFLSLLTIGYNTIFAQVKTYSGKVGLSNVFEPNEISNISSQIIEFNKSMPFPQGYNATNKYAVTQKREALKHNILPFEGQKRAIVTPIVESGFNGAMFAGIPNDNNVAVNNDSMVVSVYNSQIRVFNPNGVLKKAWNLTFFPRDVKNTQAGGTVRVLDRSYDPKIVFDPNSNRFIIVYLEGSESADTRIIVCFTKTASPLDGWNVYEINGNPIGGKQWTDYPMIAINKENLFITVNILRDSSDWRDGFLQSIIWQTDLKSGYDGDSLNYKLWSNLKDNKNKSIWSICPVQKGFIDNEKGLYFLSVRPGDVSNDTLILHHISDNLVGGNAQYSFKILKTSLPYGLPPMAPQKTAGYRLQTNDARVLGAFYANNRIQFVQSSANNINGKSGVMHSIILYPMNSQPNITSKYITYNDFDIAYPTIACASDERYGQQALITFSHSSETEFPGTSVVHYNNEGLYSNQVFTKTGTGAINTFLPDTNERWGDYTCIQRVYNKKNEFWVSGSFGTPINPQAPSNSTNNTWISKIKINDYELTLNKNEISSQSSAYPNPVKDLLYIPLTMINNGKVEITITDSNGKLIQTLSQDINAGENQAFLNVSNLAEGIYIFKVMFNGQLFNNGKFSKY